MDFRHTMSAIETQGLTKVYRLYHSPQDRLKELMTFGGRKYHHEFSALKNVSLTVQGGETIGIIGQNGSGKSTLLKILSGVIRPTSGRFHVNGRVSSLLELGAGFHADFTGRDNVYMNGALMGFSRKEMDRRFRDIEAFADIGEYLDQPVRTYSSGMYMRLAFSAAIHVDPDILIVDEVLAVGDQEFQSKCRLQIQEMRRNGKTILLVSHNMFTVESICHRVYLLDHGHLLAEGQPADVIPVYQNQMRTRPQQPSKNWGTKEVEITRVCFIDDHGRPLDTVAIAPHGALGIRLEFVAHQRVNRPVFGVSIERDDGTDVNRSNTKLSHVEIPFVEGKGAIEFRVNSVPLLPGTFLLTAGICDQDLFVPYNFWDRCLVFSVEKSGVGKEQFGVLPLTGQWRLAE
jgi:ABC-type polysaccharide/polyol phosphate transport system ATPase subunit